ncbi:7790_t:CDS:1, partial [Dentiscutata erythropus]
MTVSSSTHLAIRRDPGSNRCPLKVSLVGIILDAAQEVNEENAIIRVLVKDYVRQNNSFVVKVVFPFHNNRFKYLMNSIRPSESVLFVIGQIEIIQDDLFVYAVETSYVDTCFTDKKKGTNSSDSQSSSGLYKSVRSRLLAVYQNSNENSSKEFTAESHSILRDMNPPITKSSTSNSYSSKCVRVEDEDPNHIDSDYIEDECKEDV